ncbi:MAG: small multi-drug export protein, partial [Patescibacteria group bacterium]|nr:small multi-drug export protein [Patescibacteria group bacterium]
FSPFLNNLWQKYINRIHTNNRKKFEKWGSIILVTFVAIPLPMTGIFTGAVAASIFQIPFRKAWPLLALGSLISGIIVTLITVGATSIF